MGTKTFGTALLFLTSSAVTAQAATTPEAWLQQLQARFKSPIGAVFVSSKLNALVAQKKDGKVQLVNKNGKFIKTALDLSVANLGSQGLLDIALSPSFSKDHRVYLYYTGSTKDGGKSGALTLDRYKFNPKTGRLFPDGTILTTPKSKNNTQVSGQIAFAAGGKPYIVTSTPQAITGGGITNNTITGPVSGGYLFPVSVGSINTGLVWTVGDGTLSLGTSTFSSGTLNLGSGTINTGTTTGGVIVGGVLNVSGVVWSGSRTTVPGGTILFGTGTINSGLGTIGLGTGTVDLGAGTITTTPNPALPDPASGTITVSTDPSAPGAPAGSLDPVVVPTILSVTPAPEPTSTGFLLVSGVGVLLRRRRRL